MIARLASTDALPAERALYKEFIDTRRGAEATSEFVRNSRLFPLTAVGDINTYALFAELCLRLISPQGRAGLIVPSGIATDNSTKAYFEEITSTKRIVSLFSFENEEFIFKGVHHSYRFCILTVSGLPSAATAFVYFARHPSQIIDHRRRFTLSAEDIRLLNPNTRTCPVFRSQADAELTKKIYQRVPVLINEGKGKEGNPWGISFMAMFHMANDSHLFRSYEQFSAEGYTIDGTIWHDNSGRRWLPLYEAKMLHQFDHRWATYEKDGKEARDAVLEEKQSPVYEPLPRYWVPERAVERVLEGKSDRKWLLGFRDVTSAHVLRTTIAAVIPRVGIGHTIPLLSSAQEPALVAALLAVLNSIILDYIARLKVGGTHLTYSYLRQLAVVSPSILSRNDLFFITPRVLELSYTSHAIRPWAEDLGYSGEPFLWNPERRALLRAELDAYYAKLYGLTRDELRYILDPADIYGDDYPSETFRVLKNNEIKEFGEYRTRRLVLEAWDRLFENASSRPSTEAIVLRDAPVERPQIQPTVPQSETPPEPVKKSSFAKTTGQERLSFSKTAASPPPLPKDWLTWLRLSEWADQTKAINTYWIQFSKDISDALRNGRKLTDKQQTDMNKVWPMALKKGFRT